MDDARAHLQARFGNLLLQGRYRLLDLLGLGGMGAVFRARDERLGRDIAVKVILLALREGDADRHRRRFRREAMVAAWIRHPNVVTVHDFGTEADADGGELDFIVMELLPGADLARWMPQLSGGDPADALDVVVQAARGIAAGHRRGIVHRDVTPRNLFLSPGADGARFHVRVTDFGIARPVEAAEPFGVITVSPGLVGSPGYASPEQLAGRLDLTPASDVFGLGLVAYELLAGRRPFGDEERARLARGEAVSITPPGWTNPAVPLEIDRIVLRALHVEPGRRWPDAAAFADALDTALGRMSAATRASTPPEAATETSADADAPLGIGALAPEPAEDRRAPRPDALPLRRSRRAEAAALQRKALIAGGGGALLAASIALGLMFGASEPASPPSRVAALELADLDAIAPASLPAAFARPPRSLAASWVGNASASQRDRTSASPDGSHAIEAVSPDASSAPSATVASAIPPLSAGSQANPPSSSGPQATPPIPAPSRGVAKTASVDGSESRTGSAPRERSTATSSESLRSGSSPRENAVPVVSSPSSRSGSTARERAPERAAPSAAERARAAFARGQTAENAGRWSDAATAYREASELAPSAENRLRLGRALHRSGDGAGADRVLTALVAEDGDNAAAHRALAEVKLARRDTAAARAALRRYAVLAPSEAERLRAMRQLRDLAPRQASASTRSAARTPPRSTQPVEREGAEPVRATGALADEPASSRGPSSDDLGRDDRRRDDRGRDDDDPRDEDDEGDGSPWDEYARGVSPKRAAPVTPTPVTPVPERTASRPPPTRSQPTRRAGVFRDTVQFPARSGASRQATPRDTMRVGSNERRPAWWQEILRPRQR